MPTSYGEMAENNVVINTVLRSKQMNEGDRVKKVHPNHTLGGESRCIEGAWRGSRRNNLSFLQIKLVSWIIATSDFDGVFLSLFLCLLSAVFFAILAL